MRPERIRLKAKAYRIGWHRHYGVFPSLHNQVLALAVAISETAAGDAWPGLDKILDTDDDERNWGATTLRSLSVDERIILASWARQLLANAGLPDRGDRIEMVASPMRYLWITDAGTRLELMPAEQAAVKPLTPTVGSGHEARAKEVERLLRESPLEMPPAHIHCDSAPGRGAYFVWFAAFENDEDAAEYFVKLLCKKKDGSDKTTRAVLERESGTEQELATAMYNHGYYTGFHDPKVGDGRQRNIDEYAGKLRKIAPGVRAALKDHDTDPELVALRPGELFLTQEGASMRDDTDTERPPPDDAA